MNTQPTQENNLSPSRMSLSTKLKPNLKSYTRQKNEHSLNSRIHRIEKDEFTFKKSMVHLIIGFEPVDKSITVESVMKNDKELRNSFNNNSAMLSKYKRHSSKLLNPVDVWTNKFSAIKTEMDLDNIDKKSERYDSVLENNFELHNYTDLEYYLKLSKENHHYANQFVYAYQPDKKDLFNLVVMPRNPDIPNYVIVSGNGLTYVDNHIPKKVMLIDEFIFQKRCYERINLIRFFRNFKFLKIIRAWKSNVIRGQRLDSIAKLKSHSFLNDEDFRPYMQKHQLLAMKLKRHRLLDFQFPGVMSIKEFEEFQANHHKGLRNTVQDYDIRMYNNFVTFSEEYVKRVATSLIQYDMTRHDDSVENMYKHKYTVNKIQGVQGTTNKTKLTYVNEETPQMKQLLQQLGLPGSLMFGQKVMLHLKILKLIRFSILLDLFTTQALVTVYAQTISLFLKELCTKSKIPNTSSLDQMQYEYYDYNIFESRNVQQLMDLNAPIFITHLRENEVTIEEEDIYYVDRPKGFTDLENIVEWNLQCIEYAHDEVEDFGLTNSLHTLLVKCMITNLEEAEKDRKMIPNYRNVEKKAVSLRPVVGKFKNQLMASLIEGWTNVLRFRKVSRSEQMGKFLNVVDKKSNNLLRYMSVTNEYINPSKLLTRLKKITNPQQMLGELLEKSYNSLYQYKISLKFYWNTYYKCKDDLINMEDLLKNNIADIYTSFDYADRYYAKLEEMFNDGLKDYVQAGFLLLDSQAVNQKLREMPSACRDKLHSLMPSTYLMIFNKSMEFMSRCYEKIIKPARTIESYLELEENISSTSQKLYIVHNDIVKLYDMDRLMETLNIKNEEKECAETMDRIYKKLDYLVMRLENRHKEREALFVKVLERSIPELHSEYKMYNEVIRDNEYMDPNQSHAEVLHTLETHMTGVFFIAQKAETYIEYGTYLHWKTYNANIPLKFDEIFEYKKYVERIVEFLKTYVEYSDKNNEIYQSNLKDIDFDKYQPFYASIKDKIVSFEEMFPEHEFLKLFKTSLYTFIAKMNVVKMLKNPYYRKHHYVLLNETFHIQNIQDIKIVGQLYELELVAHQDKVYDICNNATHEHSTENQFNEALSVWTDYNFQFRDISKNPDQYFWVIDNFSQIQEDIEDMKLKLANIIKSMHGNFIRGTAKITLDNVELLDRILEEYGLLQRHWLLLEPIFGTMTELSKSMPEELERYKIVNDFFRYRAREIYKKKLVVKCMLKFKLDSSMENEEFLMELKRINKEVEEMRGTLKRYMGDKQSAFPRFYFLTVDELIDIYSRPSIATLNNVLSKSFRNINSLRVEPDGSKIYGLYSWEGECLQFSKPFDNSEKLAIDRLMGEMEKLMRSTLTDTILDCYEDYNPDMRIYTILENLNQACLAVMRSKYIENIEEIIMDRNKKEGWYYLAEEVNNFIKEQVEYIRASSDANKIDKTKVANAVILDINTREFLRQLATNDQITSQDFTWKSRVKQRVNTRATDPNETVVVEIFDFKYNYGYEYLGCYSGYVQTIENEKFNLGILSAINNKNYTGLKASGEVDRTELVRETTRMLAQNELNVRLNSSTTVESLISLFHGSLMQGNWLQLESVHQLQWGIAGLLAQFVSDIKNAWEAVQEYVYIYGVKRSFNHRFYIVYNFESTDSLQYLKSNNMRTELRASLKTFYCWSPPLKLWLEVKLSGIELGKALDISKRIASVNASYQAYRDESNHKVYISLSMAASLVKLINISLEDVSKVRKIEFDDEFNLVYYHLNKILVHRFSHQLTATIRYITHINFADKIKPEYIKQFKELTRSNTSQIPDKLGNILKESNIEFLKYHKDAILTLFELMSQLEQSATGERDKAVQQHHNHRFSQPNIDVFKSSGPAKVQYPIPILMYGKTNSFKSTCLDMALKLYQSVFNVQYKKLDLNPNIIDFKNLFMDKDSMGFWEEGILLKFARYHKDKGKLKIVHIDAVMDYDWMDNFDKVTHNRTKLWLNNQSFLEMGHRLQLVYEVDNLSHASLTYIAGCNLAYFDKSMLTGDYFISLRLKKLRLLGINESNLAILENNFIKNMEAFKLIISKFSIDEEYQLLSEDQTISFAFETIEFMIASLNLEASTLNETWTTYLMFYALLKWITLILTDNDLKNNLKLFNHLKSLLSKNCHLPLRFKSLADLRLLKDEYRSQIVPTLRAWSDYVGGTIWDGRTIVQDIMVPTYESEYVMHTLRDANSLGMHCHLIGQSCSGKSILLRHFSDSLSCTEYEGVRVNVNRKSTCDYLLRTLFTTLEVQSKNKYGSLRDKKINYFIDDLHLSSCYHDVNYAHEILRHFIIYRQVPYGFNNLSVEYNGLMLIDNNMAKCPRLQRLLYPVKMHTVSELRTIFVEIQQAVIRFNISFSDEVVSYINVCTDAILDGFANIESEKIDFLDGLYKMSLRDYKMCLRMLAVLYHDMENKDNYLELMYSEFVRSTYDLILVNDSENLKKFEDYAKTSSFNKKPLDQMFSKYIYTDLVSPYRLDNSDSLEDLLPKMVEKFNTSDPSITLDIDISKEFTLHLCKCFRAIRLKSSTFIMLGPIYRGKLQVLNLAFWLKKRHFCNLTQVDSSHALVKQLTEFLLLALNEYTPQALYVNQNSFAFRNFNPVYEFTSGADPLELFDADFIHTAEVELKKYTSRALSSEDIVYEYRLRTRRNSMVMMDMDLTTFKYFIYEYPGLFEKVIVDIYGEKSSILTIEVGLSRMSKRLNKFQVTSPNLLDILQFINEYSQDFAESKKFEYHNINLEEFLMCYEWYLMRESLSIDNKIMNIKTPLDRIVRISESVQFETDKKQTLQPSIISSKERKENLTISLKKSNELLEQMRSEFDIKKPESNTFKAKLQTNLDLMESEIGPFKHRLEENIRNLDKFTQEDHVMPIRKNNQISEEVKKVMYCICHLKNEKHFAKDLNWSVAQNQIGKADFWDSIKQMNYFKMSDISIKRVNKMLLTENADYLKSLNELAHAIFKLIMSAIDYHNTHNTKGVPLLLENEEIQKNIEYYEPIVETLQLKMEILKMNIQNIQVEISELSESIRKMETDQSSLDERINNALYVHNFRLKYDSIWQKELDLFEKDKENLKGDVMLKAAYIAYCGILNKLETEEFMSGLVEFLDSQEIKYSSDYNITKSFEEDLNFNYIHLYKVPYDQFIISKMVSIRSSLKIPYVIDKDNVTKYYYKYCKDFTKIKMINYSKFQNCDAVLGEELMSCADKGFTIVLYNVPTILDYNVQSFFQAYTTVVYHNQKMPVFLNEIQFTLSDAFKFVLISNSSDCSPDSVIRRCFNVFRVDCTYDASISFFQVLYMHRASNQNYLNIISCLKRKIRGQNDIMSHEQTIKQYFKENSDEELYTSVFLSEEVDKLLGIMESYKNSARSDDAMFESYFEFWDYNKSLSVYAAMLWRMLRKLSNITPYYFLPLKRFAKLLERWLADNYELVVTQFDLNEPTIQIRSLTSWLKKNLYYQYSPEDRPILLFLINSCYLCYIDQINYDELEKVLEYNSNFKLFDMDRVRYQSIIALPNAFNYENKDYISKMKTDVVDNFLNDFEKSFSVLKDNNLVHVCLSYLNTSLKKISYVVEDLKNQYAINVKKNKINTLDYFREELFVRRFIFLAVKEENANEKSKLKIPKMNQLLSDEDSFIESFLIAHEQKTVTILSRQPVKIDIESIVDLLNYEKDSKTYSYIYSIYYKVIVKNKFQYLTAQLFTKKSNSNYVETKEKSPLRKKAIKMNTRSNLSYKFDLKGYLVLLEEGDTNIVSYNKFINNIDQCAQTHDYLNFLHNVVFKNVQNNYHREDITIPLQEVFKENIADTKTSDDLELSLKARFMKKFLRQNQDQNENHIFESIDIINYYNMHSSSYVESITKKLSRTDVILFTKITFPEHMKYLINYYNRMDLDSLTHFYEDKDLMVDKMIITSDYKLFNPFSNNNAKERHRCILTLTNNPVDFHLVNKLSTIQIFSYVQQNTSQIAHMLDIYSRKEMTVLFMPFNNYKEEYPKAQQIVDKQWQAIYLSRKLKLIYGYISNLHVPTNYKGNLDYDLGISTSTLYKAERLYISEMHLYEFDQLCKVMELNDEQMSREHFIWASAVIALYLHRNFFFIRRYLDCQVNLSKFRILDKIKSTFSSNLVSTNNLAIFLASYVFGPFPDATSQNSIAFFLTLNVQYLEQYVVWFEPYEKNKKVVEDLCYNHKSVTEVYNVNFNQLNYDHQGCYSFFHHFNVLGRPLQESSKIPKPQVKYDLTNLHKLKNTLSNIKQITFAKELQSDTLNPLRAFVRDELLTFNRNLITLIDYVNTLVNGGMPELLDPPSAIDFISISKNKTPEYFKSLFNQHYTSIDKFMEVMVKNRNHIDKLSHPFTYLTQVYRPSAYYYRMYFMKAVLEVMRKNNTESNYQMGLKAEVTPYKRAREILNINKYYTQTIYIKGTYMMNAIVRGGMLLRHDKKLFTVSNDILEISYTPVNVSGEDGEIVYYNCPVKPELILNKDTDINNKESTDFVQIKSVNQKKLVMNNIEMYYVVYDEYD